MPSLSALSRQQTRRTFCYCLFRCRKIGTIGAGFLAPLLQVVQRPRSPITWANWRTRWYPTRSTGRNAYELIPVKAAYRSARCHSPREAAIGMVEEALSLSASRQDCLLYTSPSPRDGL